MDSHHRNEKGGLKRAGTKSSAIRLVPVQVLNAVPSGLFSVAAELATSASVLIPKIFALLRLFL